MPPPTNRDSRRRVGELARLWGEVTLGGILVVTGLALWHLRRRGRLLRDRLAPPPAGPSHEAGRPRRPDPSP